MDKVTKGITEGLAALFEPGDVMELRALKKGKTYMRSISGFFDSPNLLTQAIREVESMGFTVYVTLNPIRVTWQGVDNRVYDGGRALYQAIQSSSLSEDEKAIQVMQRLRENKKRDGGSYYTLITAHDSDVLLRRNVLVDIDAGQPKSADGNEQNSSAEEKAQALEMALAVRSYLTSLGVSGLTLADSGNGWHLLVVVNLENSDATTTLVQRFLLALDQKFPVGTFGTAHVDTGVFNAARITKAYGSLVRKGIHTPERPHRRSGIVERGDMEITPAALLEKVASEYKGSVGSTNIASVIACEEDQEYNLERLERYLEFNHIECGDAFQKDGSVLIPIECPNSPFHTSTNGQNDTVVSVMANGAFGFDCKHSHCQHLTGWMGFKKFVDEQFAASNPDAEPFRWTPRVYVGKKGKNK